MPTTTEARAMADTPRTISEIASELVARGIPRYDHSPGSRDWHGPSPCWWIHRPEPETGAPRTVLGIDGETDGEEWQFTVGSCPCCDAIARVELVDGDGYSIGALPFWPGLTEAIQLHRQVNRLWLAELERA
jgi:hypothetical protein